MKKLKMLFQISTASNDYIEIIKSDLKTFTK